MANYDPTDLRGQAQTKADADEKQRFAQVSEEDDFKWLMSSKQGRRIIWRLMSDAGVFRSTFNQNSMLMAFQEGTRSYGNQTLDKLNRLCPQLWPTLVKENTNVRNDDGNADHSN